MNFVMPKAAAKHELLFNKPAFKMECKTSLFNKRLSLAAALGMTKCIKGNAMSLVTLCGAA
jgi:hypothetical protein